MLAGGYALAADQTSGQAADEVAVPPGHAAVVKDFGKLSTDGARGYQDVKLARLAIFDGAIGDAKTIAARAEQEFAKAKTDESVFTKAEADMHTRMVAKADHGKSLAAEKSGAQANSDMSKSDMSKSDTAKGNGAQDVAKPIAWLPVDGVIGLAEDYSAQPDKAKAVAKADKKGAMDALKLAGIDLDVVTAVVPLQQTLSDVHDAVQMIEAGKYYEGSQKLRAVESSTILVSDSVTVVPTGKAAASGKLDK